MNFCQLNTNDTQRKTDELSSIFHTHNIHVDSLQKTKLNSELNLKVKGYTAIRKDRQNSSGGKIAFFVKTPDVKFVEIYQTSHSSLKDSTEVQ
ncbi:hypothetical protein TNIN_149111 [Trichonephila inaurata madagascariensis]|uniref:Uncharacterized protein n=1 Tax=Trichonephila inaurata madagascariensis TaxID=2747483 RepID=A0A8X6XAM3_9ARAC|nr:hypothetical protein TNIN_149111 [Trichonephila inaurata madagascariensis]